MLSVCAYADIWIHIWQQLEWLINNINCRGSRGPSGRLNESKSQQINWLSSVCAAAYVFTKFWSTYKTYFYNWVNTWSVISAKWTGARWILIHFEEWGTTWCWVIDKRCSNRTSLWQGDIGTLFYERVRHCDHTVLMPSQGLLKRNRGRA